MTSFINLVKWGKRTGISLTAIVIALGIAAPSHAQQTPIIEDAWARESPPGSPNGAVYLAIWNPGAADRLVGVDVSTDVAERAELHAVTQADGMMRMGVVHAIEVPAGARVALEPQGRHVMLIGLRRPLKQGETLVLRVRFENAGTTSADVPVLRQAP